MCTCVSLAQFISCVVIGVEFNMEYVFVLFEQIKRDGEVDILLCKAEPGLWVKYFGASGSGLDMADA